MTNLDALQHFSILIANIRFRIIFLLLAIGTLAFSCGDAESFVVADAETNKILGSVAEWASSRGMVSIECQKHRFDSALSGSCFESDPPHADPRYFIYSAREGSSVATVIFFNQTSKHNRERLKEELHRHLIAVFGEQNVSRGT